MATRQDEERERARLLAYALSDYEKFCKLIQVLSKDKKRCRLKLNPAQLRYHRSRTSRDIVLKGRQVGASTEAMARNVFKFLQPGERVAIVVQSVTGNAPLRGFSMMARLMLDSVQQAGIALKYGIDSESLWTLPDRDSRMQIIEAGASAAAAQKKGRGGTYTRVHVSEAAFYEYPELTTNALFEGVPATPNTEIQIESTANGVGNWFHGMWVKAAAHQNEYRPHFIPWFHDVTCVTPLRPGEVIEPEDDFEAQLVELHSITPEQLKWYRDKIRSKGIDDTKQEYPSDPVTAFLTSGRTYFDTKALGAMTNSIRAPEVIDL